MPESIPQAVRSANQKELANEAMANGWFREPQARVPLSRVAFLNNVRRSPGVVEYAVEWGEIIDALDWPDSGKLEVGGAMARLSVIGGRFWLSCMWETR